MVDPYNGLFDNKKGWITNTCYDIDNPWKHYARWNIMLESSHKIPNTIWYYFYEMTTVGKLREVESKLVTV